MDVSTFVKGFQSTDEVKSLKEALTEFKAWTTECKKGCNKRKRMSISAASKSTKSQKVAQLLPGTNSKLGEVLLEMFQNNTVDGIQEDTGVQFAAAEWIIKENTAYALVLSANQNQQLLQDWLALPYYQQQKEWMAENWKKSGGPELSTNVVAKPQLCTKLNKEWLSCLGTHAAKSLKDVATDGDLKEVFSPMFWSMGQNTTKLYFTTDYALTEFKICLEGKSVCCGFQIPSTMLQKGFKAFCDDLLGMDPLEFLKICQKKGWIVHLTPGKAVAIPSGHCYCQMAPELTHGSRLLKLRSTDERTCIGLLTARVGDYPELLGMRTGRLLTWISGEESTSSAAASAAPVATPAAANAAAC